MQDAKNADYVVIDLIDDQVGRLHNDKLTRARNPTSPPTSWKIAEPVHGRTDPIIDSRRCTCAFRSNVVDDGQAVG